MLASTFFRFAAPFSFMAAVLAVNHAGIAEHQRRDRRDICDNVESKLVRRDGVSVGGNVDADVSLPSVGLSLGNISTKIGNINLTVTNVTISTGDIEISNIAIGNITIIVSVPLPGASPVQAFSALTPARSIATSTGKASSTYSSGTSVFQTATTLTKRQEQEAATTTTVDLSTATTATSSGTGPSVSATAGVSAGISGGPVNLNTGSVTTEIGNVSIFVGHVNVSIGDVKIKNVTIGNIFVLVQIGQPDLAGLGSNVTNAVGKVIDGVAQ